MNNMLDDDMPNSEDECCKCGKPMRSAEEAAEFPEEESEEEMFSVQLKTTTYLFCSAHELRGMFLQRGLAHNWPALRIEGVTGRYAIDHDWEAWMLTAICGTDERVVELLDALDEYELEKAG